MNLQDFIQGVRTGLDCPGAHALYFPPDAQKRKEYNLRLAREIGPALAAYDPAAVSDVLGSLYGILIVAHSLDLTGVQIDNRDWLAELRASIDDWRGRQSSPPAPAILAGSSS